MWESMEVQNLSSVHPVAIVTGASSGIGLEYARELCSRGYDVVMVSNEEERLTQHAGELSQTYEVQTWPLYMDLSLPDAAEHLHGFCVALGLQVEVLVNNFPIRACGESFRWGCANHADVAYEYGCIALSLFWRGYEKTGKRVYSQYVFHVGLVFLSGHFVIRFHEVFFEEFFPGFSFGDA